MRSAWGWLGLACVLVGCSDDEPSTPLGMRLDLDGRIYAGVAAADVTPAVGETFTDLNGDHHFDGCLDDPTASRDECDEPFDDANGNGRFDPVWIGGFGPRRPALEVHDAITARAVVISHGGEYVAFVALDVVGLGSPRIHEARDRLIADGFEGKRLIVASSHNHGGPDTMGLWGDPEAFHTGLDHEYQALLAGAIERLVREAAASMVPVTLEAGAVAMRDRDPTWFNGSQFGGKNPTAKMHGLIHDGRDPVVVSDQLLVMRGIDDADATVFTLTNWSGHPETRDSSNNALTSDYVGVMREVIEAELGGVALHLPESLGGMQSSLGGDVPLVDDAGVHQFEDQPDADGDLPPVWAERSSWAYVNSLGWHIGEAALAALEAGERHTAAPIRVEVEPFLIPVHNSTYNLLAPFDVFELGLDNAVLDPELCPEGKAGETAIGCVETNTFRVRVGPVGFTGVPGEILPELSWGLPTDDPRWAAEASDPTARGDGAVFFPQHPEACNAVDYDDCRGTMSVGDCDCLRMHAVPYRISDDPAQKALLDAWNDVTHRAIIGMADNYLSYIIPEPDFNTSVSLLTDDGDHYEDTVSPSQVFGTRLLEAQGRIDARW